MPQVCSDKCAQRTSAQGYGPGEFEAGVVDRGVEQNAATGVFALGSEDEAGPPVAGQVGQGDRGSEAVTLLRRVEDAGGLASALEGAAGRAISR
ncbi:hypothetical protein TNCT1_68610 [Streptomyces sp. 1-11]|nr:hypothetical protein TNCT1_68610 [Streptomyces sp. 1-11]